MITGMTYSTQRTGFTVCFVHVWKAQAVIAQFERIASFAVLKHIRTCEWQYTGSRRLV